MIRGWIVAAVLGVAILIFWQGHRMGYAAAEADHNAELLVRIEEGRKLEDERRALAVERDKLARQLEEESHDTPVYVDRCLAPERVRRLDALR